MSTQAPPPYERNDLLGMVTVITESKHIEEVKTHIEATEDLRLGAVSTGVGRLAGTTLAWLTFLPEEAFVDREGLLS